MFVKSCLQKNNFCYDAFLDACLSLSVQTYVWQPTGQEFPQSEQHLPVLNTKERNRLTKLFMWAEKTDPGATIRMAKAKQGWEGRETGAIVFFPKSATGLAKCS